MVMEPECQCSSTRPVTSQMSNSLSGFGRRFVGHRNDPRLAVLVAVEVDALAGLDVGIEAFAIAPLRFLAVDDGPSQPRTSWRVSKSARSWPWPRPNSAYSSNSPSARRSRKPSLRGFRIRREFRGGNLSLAVAEQHVEQRLAAVIGIVGQDLRRPHLVGGEALRELHHLPEVGACLAGRVDELPPHMGAALGVAVGAFFSTHIAVGRTRSAAIAVTVG